MTKTVDTRGQLCPQPIITTKSALDSLESAQIIEVLTDNDMACSNLINYLSDRGITPTIEQRGDHQALIFDSEPSTKTSTTPIDCPVPTPAQKPSGSAVLVLRSNKMGEGESALGEMLMRSYLNTLTQLDTLPHTILVYNGGVHCTIKGTDTADAIDKLIEKGVKVIVCGACVDFYDLKGKTTGEVSNMFVIAQTMLTAEKVIFP